MKDIMHHLKSRSISRTDSSHDRGSGKRLMTPVYRVGEYFRKNIRSWPEGAEFTHGPAGFELTLFQTNVDDASIEGVRKGRAEFALIVDSPVLVIAYRFEKAIPWSDVPYYWHLRPTEDRQIPLANPGSGHRALFWITLVDATTGLIEAQRGVALSTDFTTELMNAIRSQAMVAADPAGCTSAMSRIFLNYPRTIDRLSLAVVRTGGND